MPPEPVHPSGSGGSSGYDANENVTSYDDGIYVTTYGYDALNRLTRENNQKAGKTYVYAYSHGNLTSRSTYAYTTGTLGTVQATDTYTYGKTQFHDRLTAYNGVAITYASATGSMTAFGDYALSWYRAGLLSSYSKTGDTHTFTYDMDGRRLSRTDNGTTTTFVYAGDQLVGQTWGGNTLAFILDAAGDYIGFTYNGTNYYYVKNLQGDVVQIVNANKTTVVKYYYDAWGYNFATEGSLASTVGAVNPIRYRSYYYDAGTGLYFLQSRYYNPTIRRFISPDKLLDAQSYDGFNLFAYCENNPGNTVDISGKIPIDVFSDKSMEFYWIEIKKETKSEQTENALGKASSQLIEKHNVTTIGISGSLHAGFSASYMIGLVFDLQDEYAYDFYSGAWGGGIIGGTPFALSIGFFDIENAYNLEGQSTVISINLFFVSYQFVSMVDSYTKEPYYGHIISFGPSFGCPIGFSGELSYTSLSQHNPEFDKGWTVSY